MRIPSLLLLGVLVVPVAQAQTQSPTPPRVREAALSRVARAQAMASDALLVQAVAAKNASGETLDEVKAKDREWSANRGFALRKQLSTNACAQRLQELTKDDPMVVEAILMDAQGANVCVSRETSDYWQGDEPKFQKSFGADKELFLDEAALDASTGAYAIQLTVIVFDRKVKAGALTLTLRVAQPATPGAGQ